MEIFDGLPTLTDSLWFADGGAEGSAGEVREFQTGAGGSVDFSEM